MDLRLSGKAALVVGGSAGIGRAVAEEFSREGVRVALAARAADRVEAAAREIRGQTNGTVIPFAADVSDAEQGRAVVRDAVAALGGLDILVNSVPSPVFGPFMEHSDLDWESAMRTKFFAYVRTIHEAVPHLSRGGVIINVIGTGGKAYLTNHLAGGASNAALMLVSMGLAKELGPRGIRVVGVSPGATRTERLDRIMSHLADQEQSTVEDVQRGMAAATPSGSVPEASDVADLITFLASSRARQVNGTVVTVDGGVLQSL